MKTIGTWITRRALAAPEATAAQLAAAGVTMGSIMLNDFSAKVALTPFETHDPAKVIALADALRANGIEVTLTTWIMPHEKFIVEMIDQLTSLLEATRATALVLDAEEPWVRAMGSFDREYAAIWLRHSFSDKRLILSGIGWPNDALGPLAEVCNVWSPQAYATTKAKSMSPDTAVESSMERWRERFGNPDEWMIGLASYRQPAPASLYMQPCLDQCKARGVESVCYWSHRPILERKDVAAVIMGINDPYDEPEDLPLVSSGSVMPLVDIEGLPSGIVDPNVAQIQGLLTAASLTMDATVHPGKIDGLPGPKTQGALESFQDAHGLVVGDCDGATWWHLLSAV